MTAILVILLLVVINGVFVMAEMAVVSSRKPRLQQLANEGRGGAQIARQREGILQRIETRARRCLHQARAHLFRSRFRGSAVAHLQQRRLQQVTTHAQWGRLGGAGRDSRGHGIGKIEQEGQEPVAAVGADRRGGQQRGDRRAAHAVQRAVECLASPRGQGDL